LNACGDAISSSYKIQEELEEWLYLVSFPNKGLVVIINVEPYKLKEQTGLNDF
tara:strand:- start:134 stop:292 length:159 start_codon:yes stop_codon:yes gene_type:complete